MSSSVQQLVLLQVCEAKGARINKPEELILHMKSEGKADRECYWVVHLNTKNRILEKELVALGALNACSISMKELFRSAVAKADNAIICVHNHPSGDPSPSPEDKTMQETVDQAGKLLGIKILDHIIITPNGSYYSREEEIGLSSVIRRGSDNG